MMIRLKIVDKYNKRLYDDKDNTVEIAIETNENAIIIKDYNPEISIMLK